MPFNGCTHAMTGTAFFRRLIDKLADNCNGNSRLIVLIDQLGHLQQRPRHAHRKYEEGKKRSKINRIIGRKRKINANSVGPANGEPLQRPHACLD